MEPKPSRADHNRQVAAQIKQLKATKASMPSADAFQSVLDAQIAKLQASMITEANASPGGMLDAALRGVALAEQKVARVSAHLERAQDQFKDATDNLACAQDHLAQVRRAAVNSVQAPSPDTQATIHNLMSAVQSSATVSSSGSGSQLVALDAQALNALFGALYALVPPPSSGHTATAAQEAAAIPVSAPVTPVAPSEPDELSPVTTDPYADFPVVMSDGEGQVRRKITCKTPPSGGYKPQAKKYRGNDSWIGIDTRALPNRRSYIFQQDIMTVGGKP